MSLSLPTTVSEAEFLSATAAVTQQLTSRFAALFGGEDDFGQEVVIWSLEAVKSYDPAIGPLGGLLYRHARNRCLNRIRDKVFRNDAPCTQCHTGTPCGADGQPCARYAAWYARNRRKANLHNPLSTSAHPMLVETQLSPLPTAVETTTGNDLSELIDRELPMELRADYLRMRDSDVSVPLRQRQEVQRAVVEILRGAGLDAPEPESNGRRYGRDKRAKRGVEKGEDAVAEEVPLGAHLAPPNNEREVVGAEVDLAFEGLVSTP